MYGAEGELTLGLPKIVSRRAQRTEVTTLAALVVARNVRDCSDWHGPVFLVEDCDG